MQLANLLKYVAQRGFIDRPISNNVRPLQLHDGHQQLGQINAILDNGEGIDVRLRFQVLDIPADLGLHVLHHIRDFGDQREREQEALSELVLQLHLVSDALQSVARHDRDPRAQRVRFLHRVGRDQNRHFLLDSLHNVPNRKPRLGIQAGLHVTPNPSKHRRFVQEEEPRLAH